MGKPQDKVAPTIVMLEGYFQLNSMATFYINSSTGSDSNNGTSPATPWRTLQKYTAGSTYLFNRGDTFYTKIPANNSTTAALPINLSAYGTGAKPIISNYTRVIAGWTLTSRTNVWLVNLATTANRSQFIPAAADLGDVGFLNVDGTIWGNKLSALTSLAKQWDFFSDGTNTLYVWSNGSPATHGTIIQCTTSGIAVTPSNWWSMSEIKIQGSGGTSVRGITKNNVTITNVDITEVGGSYVGTGTTRFGAGISFDEGGADITVTGCNITQIYEAGFTTQSHATTGTGFANVTFANNSTDQTESGYNPSIETGVAGSPGYANCRVHDNTFNNAGTSWSHNVRPVDNQSVAIFSVAWDTNDHDLILENNTIYAPREGVYYLGGKFNDPRFTTRNNSICISPNVLIRKNFQGATTPYTYTLTGATSGLDYQDFVAQQGYEVGSTWYSLDSTGNCILFSGLSGTYKTGTSSSTVCSQPNTTLYTKGSFAQGKTLYTDSGTTTAKTGASFVVQVSTNRIFNLSSTTGVIGADTGLICGSGVAGTYKTGTTLTTVCSQTNTTLYTSGAFGAGKILYTDANLTTAKTGASFVVTVADNHIWTISNAGVIGSDTGNICNSGTGATYIVGNTLGTVCSGSAVTLYTSGAFAIGKVLYQDINLITIETGFVFVVQSSTNHVFNLNSSTGVVGSDTGTICGGGTGATYKLSNSLTSVCSAPSVTLYTNGSFNVGDTLYSDINLVIPETGFSFVVQVATNHIFNLNSTTGVVGSDTGSVCNSGTAGNYIVGNTLATICNGTAGTLYTSGAFAIAKTLYTDINLLVVKTGFIYVVQSSTGHVFDLDSSTGVVGSDTGTVCGEVPVDCTSSQRKKYGIYGLGLISNLTQFNAFLPSMQGFHFRWVWSSYETSANAFNSSYLINQLKIAFNNCLYTGLEMFVAPQSNGTTPAYIFQPPYNVPSAGTNAATDNTFPYYFYKDASNVFQFKQRYQNVNTEFRSDIALAAQWSAQWQGRMLFLLSAEGYSGDENPYNGTVVNSSFAITEASWNTYKQTEVWNGFYSAINTSLSFLKLMINQGNDNSSFQWGLSNTPTAWLKAGEFGQVYNFSNEKNYAALLISLKTSATNSNRVGAELEATTVSAAWWTVSPSLNIMAMVCSALHSGVDILAIRPQDALTSTAAYDFFNKYAGLRNATDSNIGFCALRDVIDLADLNRFSEATYGTLVASSDQATYNTQFNAINASGLPAAQIQYQLTHLLTSGNSGVPYVNATRITNLRNAFPAAGYQPINNDTPTTIHSYNQDFGVNMIAGNYGKFITQFNANGTSVGVWKVTSVSDFWGRFGRRTDFATAKNELFFAVNSGLAAANNYRVTIKVTYLNNGGGTWVLNYFNATAKVSAGSTTNGATAVSAQKTFTINDFQGGGNLSNATDFSLQRTAGADSTFFAVELTVVSQNTTGTAGTYIVGNTLSTVCAGAPVTLFTNGAFGVGQTLYSDIILLTPETGFSFVVNTATNHVFDLNSLNGQVGADTGVICGSGTAGVYKTSGTLSNVCSQAATTLYTNGSFAVGKTLYTDINLTTPKTGSLYLVTTSDNHIYNLDSTTGVIGTDTGNICNSGTAGSYILGTALSTVCAGLVATRYTSGSFAVGKTLYTDINLLIPETGFTFVVTTTDNHVYNLNISTGVIGSDTGIICGSGTAANYILGNTLSTVCDGSTTVLYTSGSFAVAKTLYTDINLTTIQTGFTFVIQNSTNHVFNLNTSTGVVGSDTGIICNSGTAGTYILGNNSGTVCAGTPVTRYTSGSFAVAKTLYTTNDLTTAVTGFTFLVFNNEIYNLNTSTGVIGSDTTVSCTGTGTAGTYKVGNTLATVCAAVSGTLYTDGAFAIGGILYTDIGLTTPETGFVYVVNTATNGIYDLDTSTGVIGSQVGTCNGGTASTVKLGNTLSTVCAAGSSTAYTIGVFTIGKTLYSDIDVTIAITGSTFVVLTSTNHVYNLNTSTGVIGADTGIICGSGTSGTYRVGNTLSTVCAQTTGTLYTNGAFAAGKTLYTDINLTTAKTGAIYVEETVSNHVYNLNTSTGVVGSDTGIVCGSGTSGTYKLGSAITTVCNQVNTTLYTSGTFNVGDVLYTDVNLTLPQTGFTFVTEVGSNHVFHLDTSTGVVGSDTGTICGSGTSGTYKVGNVLTTVCNAGNVTLYTTAYLRLAALFTQI
jgi:hypothetical protein